LPTALGNGFSCTKTTVHNLFLDIYSANFALRLNYFSNFIKTGNPNGDKLPEWATAKTGDANPPVMILNTESKTVNAKDDARYEFLDKAYKNK
jgi:carboxylesterase type B